MSGTTNVLLVGTGGQGVLKAAQILARTAFICDYDVKQSEVHGMSQRGGSVECQVRLGGGVASPLIPSGEADYVVALTEDEGRRAEHHLRPGGTFLAPYAQLRRELPSLRSLNVAMLGALSVRLSFPAVTWRRALRQLLPESTHPVNLEAFALGRQRAELCARRNERTTEP